MIEKKYEIGYCTKPLEEPKKEEIKLNWNDFDNKYSLDTSYYYLASNGIDLYYYYNNQKGLHYRNMQTGEQKQIYTSGFNWKNFFEDSRGNIYVGSSGGSGLLYLKKDYCVLLFSASDCSYFFETSDNNVYVSGTYLFHINGEKYSKISDFSVSSFFENSKGNLYAGGANDGIIKINNSYVEKIYENGRYWQFNFEDTKGNIYISSANSSYKGILVLNNGIVNQSYSEGYKWENFFEDSKGNIYASGTSSTNVGIIKFDGSSWNQIYSNYQYKYFFETSNGVIYVGSYSNPGGIVCIDGDNVVQTYTKGNNWQYFYEDTKENVYVGSSDTTGIILLNTSSSILLYNVGKNWKYFFNINDETYVSKIEKPQNKENIIKLNGENYELFYFVEGENNETENI